ncbi:uncharacterized protein LOC119674406 [Teleopsis dalmanni]|uniref:uncharacterized protein LOC119674406 n=1 Tax=Teleopsis dalmanni TaxID=139649 RepID=UPI0018CDB3ED|nr:uncharacterized protein LOC119674406 [Teleopsis dalmanni]
MCPLTFFDKLLKNAGNTSIQEISQYISADCHIFKQNNNCKGSIGYYYSTTNEGCYIYNINPALAIILNHQTFEKLAKFQARYASKYDILSLQRTFTNKRIPYITVKDGSAYQVTKLMETVGSIDFTGFKQLYIIIMSHGTKGDIIHTKDGCYNINDTVLSPLLRNETLKPIQKLIIINPCRTGDMESDLVQVSPLRLPQNLTIMYSAAKDRESYLFKSGALFIQKFCEDFEKPFTVYSLGNIFERLKMKLSIEME